MPRFNKHAVPGYTAAVERERSIRETAFLGLNEYINGVEVLPLNPILYSRLNAIDSPFITGQKFNAAHIAIFLWIVSPQWRPVKVGKKRSFKFLVSSFKFFTHFTRPKIKSPRARQTQPSVSPSPGGESSRQRSIDHPVQSCRGEVEQSSSANISPQLVEVGFNAFLKKRYLKSIREKCGNERLPNVATAIAIYAYLKEAHLDAPQGGKSGETPLYSMQAWLCDEFESEYGWPHEQTLSTPYKKLFQILRRIQKRRDPRALLCNGSDKILTDWVRDRNRERRRLAALRPENTPGSGPLPERKEAHEAK